MHIIAKLYSAKAIPKRDPYPGRGYYLELGCHLRRDAETGCYPVSTDTELDNIKEAHHNGKV